MNSIRKHDLLLLALGIVVFAVLQGLISARIIGSFWQLNLLIIGINVIMENLQEKAGFFLLRQEYSFSKGM